MADMPDKLDLLIDEVRALRAEQAALRKHLDPELDGSVTEAPAHIVRRLGQALAKLFENSMFRSALVPVLTAFVMAAGVKLGLAPGPENEAVVRQAIEAAVREQAAVTQREDALSATPDTPAVTPSGAFDTDTDTDGAR